MGFGQEPEKTKQARQILFEVVSREPRFVPALTDLAKATMYLSDHPSTRGPMPHAQARREAARYARRAIGLAPDYGPAYSALAFAYMGLNEALVLDRKAVELNPGNSNLHGNLATSLTEMGDWQGALAEYQIATKLDPLNVGQRWALVQSFRNTGRLKEARAALDDYLRLSVSEKIKLQMISSLGPIIYGDDPSKPYLAARLAHTLDPQDPWTERILFSLTLPLFGSEAAAVHAGEPNTIPALVSRGDVTGLERHILGMGPDFWLMEGDRETALHFLLRRHRPGALIALYDRARNAGVPADDDPFMLAETVVMLRQAGRTREANVLMASRARRLRTEKAAPQVKMFGWAEHFALAGDRGKALKYLREAHREQWFSINNVVDHPYNRLALDDLRDEPQFRALVRDYDALMARERREALLDLRREKLAPPKSVRPFVARIGGLAPV
jgi:tetratricopeptide (TPR) repeat protein